MEKEIKVLIGMCLSDKDDSHSAMELATLLNLKYVEGVYPYLRKLLAKNMIERTEDKEYALNKQNHKVQDVLFITEIIGKKAEILFTRHAKKVLEKFSGDPVVERTKLPRKSLDLIKDIANNTKIIHPIEGGKQYFINAWEETTKKLLDFFDIKIKFDEEELKFAIKKYYSSMSNTKTPIDVARQNELKMLNVDAYLHDRDFILNRLKEHDFDFLAASKTMTDAKMKAYSSNPFTITTRITDWKMCYIYNTDRIEGNPLTMQDVRAILTTGATQIQNDKKSVLETTNSRTALDNIFNTDNEFDEEFIKKLHLATQYGIDDEAGEYKRRENCITDNSGGLLDNTTPADFVQVRMAYLVKWYREKRNALHPFVLASIVHNQFVYIHPFNDGNGRVARLLFNFILIKNGFVPIIFYNDEKEKYYACIRSGKDGTIKQFVTFCFRLYRTQLDEF